jgi:AcrR family transcriptional regulator
MFAPSARLCTLDVVVPDTRSGLREQKRLETWRALRAAAFRLIDARGFDAVSVDEIAAEAHVAKRTFFNYFESKEAVIFDSDPEEPQRWQALVDARPADEPLWVSLREVLLGFVDAYGTKLAVLKGVLTSSPELARSSRDASGQFRSFMDGWIRDRAAARGHDRFYAALLSGTAFTVLGTAFELWDPAKGFGQFTRLVRQGFTTAGAGLLEPPAA